MAAEGAEPVSALLAELAPIGRHAGTGGYRRFAWTATDAELREWFAGHADARGLGTVEDQAGNLWAWAGDPDAAGPGVVTGSHLDSVPDGGAYDGPLGVVSAFVALDLLRARGATFARPLGIACFADEEGARFGIACAGSRLLTGLLDPARALSLTDADGMTMADALAAAGRDPAGLGSDPAALSRVGCYVELHVEQGRGLVDLDEPVAVGTAIWPHGRWRMDFAGEANHAGTTRLADRRDPVLPFARTALAVRAAAERAGAVATVGRVRVEPNGTNAVPSQVTAWLDVRARAERTVRRVVADVAEAGPDEVAEESWSPEVAFDRGLRDRLDRSLRGVPALATGAGHDAGILAVDGVPTGMLFVRNPTGVSHSPAEHAEPEDCEAGAEALATVLADLLA